MGEREVYGRRFVATSKRLWILQRVSGLLLAPTVGVHVAWPAVGEAPVFLALLLALVAWHGYAGLRRLRPRVGTGTPGAAPAVAWTAVVVVAGAAIVLLSR